MIALAVLGACLAGGVWWLRRDVPRFVEFTLWVWVLAPGLRRILDWRIGFHPDSPVLLTPLLLGAAALIRVPVRVGATPVERLMLRAGALALYAVAVAGLLGRSPAAAGIGVIQLLAPLSLGLLVLTHRGPAIEAVVTRWATGTLLLVGGYGVVQFLVAPAWDRQWLIDISDEVNSFGRPAPLEIRVFSTVNDPGSLSAVLVLGLLWLLLRRRAGVLTTAALVVGGSCLALTLVRSAWIALAVALLLGLLRGWIRTERVVLVGIGLVVAATFFGTALQPVVDRWQESKQAGTHDVSFQARLGFQSRQMLPALSDVLGDGTGSTGVAVRRDRNTDQRFADTDSGYLETLRTFGGPLGLLLLASTLSAIGWAFRRPPESARGAALFATTAPVQLLFASVYGGVFGLVFWLALALTVPVPAVRPRRRSGVGGSSGRSPSWERLRAS